MEAKKNKSVDYDRKRGLFLSIGLCISSLIAFSAFQIEAENEPEVIVFTEPPFEGDMTVVERTVFPEPKIPKPIKLIEVIDEEEIDVDLPTIDIDFDEKDIIADIFVEPMDDEIAAEPEGIVIAEVEASFPGGKEAWAKFLQKNLKYPKLAKRSGIEGKVLISFVVDKNGNTSDIEVLRGIGGGCDDEAVRVIKMAPKWNPGLQRGNPVKSRMNLYIHFLLK